jgi:hypothetical protein
MTDHGACMNCNGIKFKGKTKSEIERVSVEGSKEGRKEERETEREVHKNPKCRAYETGPTPRNKISVSRHDELDTE